MSQDELEREIDTHALVQSVHQELRADFLRSMPGRVAALERIARSMLDSPGDAQWIHMLHAEAHRLAGTIAVYGMLRASAVVKQFDRLLLERMESGIFNLGQQALQTFLADLNRAIAAET